MLLTMMSPKFHGIIMWWGDQWERKWFEKKLTIHEALWSLHNHHYILYMYAFPSQHEHSRGRIEIITGHATKRERHMQLRSMMMLGFGVETFSARFEPRRLENHHQRRCHTMQPIAHPPERNLLLNLRAAQTTITVQLHNVMRRRLLLLVTPLRC